MYADYSYYTTTYGGSAIPATDYNRAAQQAEAFIDYYTLGRARQHTDDDRIKRAACAMAERYYAIEQVSKIGDDAAITSETVGPHSVTYDTPTDITNRARDEISSLARQYLWPYAYRGVPVVG